MKRRDFIKVGMVSVAALSMRSLTGCSGGGGGAYQGLDVDLRISGALAEMVDGQTVFMWAYEDLNQTNPALKGPRVPGPLINALEGAPIRVTVTNNSAENHGFAVPGIVDLGTIPPGQTREKIFTAPTAGTYMYLDPLNAPVNRVLGLQGAFVVLPKIGNTPYSSPSDAVQKLFNDLGTTTQFPKFKPQDPTSPTGWQRERTKIWLMNQIDPRFNARAQKGETISPDDIRANFLPRYFTINGKTGVFAAHDPDILLDGRIGQPMLVRILNAGLYTHSNHLHANHFYLLSLSSDLLQGNSLVQEINDVQSNVFFLDSLQLSPEERMDWLVPFIRPPDIAGDPNIQLRNLIPNELALTIPGSNGSPGIPQSPLPYPMHCHMETSQTAAGGNYPQGSITHFNFLGDVDGVDFPNSGGM